MNRDYDSGIKDDVIFFIGTEIEHTPAYGKKTLFVVGLQEIEKIVSLAKENECDHIYLGANHSFDDVSFEAQERWEQLAGELLREHGYWVTLDFDVRYYDAILDLLCYLNEHDRFIAQISVKLPYLSNLNYNACIKIDDKDFKATNPGVWVHQVHDLMDRKVFTDWTQYKKDEAIDGR